jgi:hypothetical protein
VLDLTLQQNAIRTRFPSIAINETHPLAAVVLRPDVITDSQGNPGVASLSPAAAPPSISCAIKSRGATFNPNPWVDSPDRKLPYTWSWSAGINHQFSANAAVAGRLRRQCLARPTRRHRHQ